MFTLLKLPFKIIGWLISVVVKLITAVLFPVAALGGAGYLGYTYLKGNPKRAEQLKNTVINKVKGK